MRQVGVQRHLGALGVECQRRHEHRGVVVMVVAHARRRIHPGVRREYLTQRLDNLARWLVGLTVLAVQKRQVDSGAAGECKRAAVLFDARLDHRG